MRTSLAVYVAAPYGDGTHVREYVHPRLIELGMRPTSLWVERANGQEMLHDRPVRQLRELARTNDEHILSSGAILLLSRKGAGGEAFAEVALALSHGIPVVWAGHRTLSAWRPGVIRVTDFDGAIEALVKLARLHDTFVGLFESDVLPLSPVGGR